MDGLSVLNCLIITAGADKIILLEASFCLYGRDTNVKIFLYLWRVMKNRYINPLILNNYEHKTKKTAHLAVCRQMGTSGIRCAVLYVCLCRRPCTDK